MNKNKKIIIIIISVVLLVAIAIGLLYVFSRQKKEEPINTTDTIQTSSIKPTLSKIYEKLLQGEVYSFSVSLDDNNKKITVRDGQKARIDLYQNGVHTTDIIKDGATYLITHADKKYYEYKNTTIELTNLLRKFERVKKNSISQRGEEAVENIFYYYEEYKNTAEFLMEDTGGAKEEASTKFYFKDNAIVYIKTILKDREELLKVEMSYSTGNTSFEIPENYEKVEI